MRLCQAARALPSWVCREADVVAWSHGAAGGGGETSQTFPGSSWRLDVFQMLSVRLVAAAAISTITELLARSWKRELSIRYVFTVIERCPGLSKYFSKHGGRIKKIAPAEGYLVSSAPAA